MAIFKNPADTAQNYVSQIPGTVTPLYQPYVDAGNQALSATQNQYGMLLQNGQPLQQQYRTMATNPVSVIGKIGSQYHMSPGASFQEQQGEQAIANAAASGGMTGTPEDQYESAKLATSLTDEDFNKFMHMALGIGRAGLAGEQNLYTRGLHGEQETANLGYRASSQLAQTLAQVLMQQANLGYASTANQNQHIGGLIGMAGDLVSKL